MIDPIKVAESLTANDPWLIDYLKGWWGIGPAQPWGAATSFALEVAHGYGLIRGECDTTETDLGLAVHSILTGEDGE